MSTPPFKRYTIEEQTQIYNERMALLKGKPQADYTPEELIFRERNEKERRIKWPLKGKSNV